MTRLISFVAATLVVVMGFIAFAGTAAAHERRTVGPYEFEVGWLNEPAFAGLMNGLDLSITDTRSGKGVQGLEKTLTVELQTGGLAPLPLTLAARFGTPGAYEGNFMPTVAGTYTFHIKGKIDTQNVDEKFESGPGRFDDVDSATAVQYPVKVPTGEELSKRLDDLQGGLDQTRLLSAAALVIGIVALGAAFAVSRRRA
ncbi:MAG: hypothetical protein E6J35_12415 [Chloroflexi bacterium]|nr:MAG: hypothetical protein E6J35_12415 [Chloroflexota bacterium]TME88919.1 MAG: hypothetical protein E6I44_05005 [Chloroflexota bacterium]